MLQPAGRSDIPFRKQVLSTTQPTPTMSSQPILNILAGARNTNATHAQFISAGGDVTIIQVDYDEKILATLMPVERGGHIHGCMKGTRKDVLMTG
jgi:hypothetical protein